MAHDRAKVGDQVRLLTRILTPAKLKLAEQRSRKATGVGSTPTAGSRSMMPGLDGEAPACKAGPTGFDSRGHLWFARP